MACGPQKRDAARPSPSPILAPDASLLPIARPPAAGLSAAALQRIRRGELYLEGLLERHEAAKADLGVAYGELGKLYQAFGFPELAVACYENAGRLQPSTFDWPYLRARALGQPNRDDEALAAVGKALAIHADSLPALLFAADLHRKAGRLEAARSAFERALELSPRCAVALYGLGDLAFLAGDYKTAIQRFESALQAQPQASRIHYPLSLAYARVGASGKAQRHLELRGNVDPAVDDPLFEAMLRLSPHLVARRGLEALRAGNLRAARALLARASELLPEDPEIRQHLGAALARSGDFDGALLEYQEAVRLQPKNPRAHYNLGTTLSSLGEDEEALESFRRAVQIHPEYPQALFNLAQTLRRLDKDAEALPHLEQVVRLDPTHEPARLARARLLAQLGRCREALAGAEQGVSTLSKSGALRALLARLLAACKADGAPDTPRALRLAQQVFAEQGSTEYAATVAFVQAARGDWKEAVTWQRRALALLPAAGAPARPSFEKQLADYQARRLSVEW